MKNKRVLSTIVGVFGFALSAGIGLGQPVERTTTVQELQPFTHVAVLPANVDPATIRFEAVKATKVATETKRTADQAYCHTLQAPSDSLYCPHEQLQGYAPAYEVTYSFAGQMEESGSAYSMFRIYLRPEEMPAALKDGLASRKFDRKGAAEYFRIKTVHEAVGRMVVDEAKSSFCEGGFTEGAWMHADSKCEDKISYTTAMTPADSIVVRVDAISLAVVQAANVAGK